MNYHELTMNEPKNSPAKKQQFAVICSVIVAAISYAVMTSGVLLSVQATEGIFPGGKFCYKIAQRDYAASMGLARRVTYDVMETKKPNGKQRKEMEEITYHLFLDNPLEVNGRRLRWATGILVSRKDNEKVSKLMSLNKIQPQGDEGAKTTKRYLTEEELIGVSASEYMDILPYEVADLPSVDSLVVQFPHTHGFVSALVMSYKVRTINHNKFVAVRCRCR